MRRGKIFIIVLLCALLGIIAVTQTTAIYGPITTPSLTIGTGPTIKASGGGTTTFLRADGQWTTPAGGSGGPVYAQTSVAAGDTVASSCTGSGCNFASGTYTFSAGTFCPSVGTVYHIHNAGLTTTTATAGNAGAEIEIGSTVISSQQLYQSANLTNLPWSGDTWITCVATGASGAVEVDYSSPVQTSTSANSGATVVDNPPNTATFPVNTTMAVTITAFAHFTGSGSVTERQVIITAP